MMWIWLAIVISSTVLAKTENFGGFGYELIITALETLQNNDKSLEHNLKSIGTNVEQLSTQLFHHTKNSTAKINQFLDVAIGGESRCPENGDDGVYQLKPDYSNIPPFSVYCENGWIVIHRRFNGSLNFDRNWIPYRDGFGDLQGEHWLGLEKMHQITRVGSYELMVVLKGFDGVVKTAKYDSFKIGSEIEFYRLDSALFGGGDAGDSLEYHYNTKFSTPDRDNDDRNTSCAASFNSGWWFKACHHTNLNGFYEEGNTNSMSWYRFNKKHECLKEARMMIRATQLLDHTNIATAKTDVAIEGEVGCPENAVDGIYQLKPDYSSIPPFSVYCENGWIVIHRRFNGSLNFNRKWFPYREGFGDLQGEHWLGLEKMHQITRGGSYELMVVLKSFDGVVKTAKYDSFKIGSENEFYRLDSALFGGGDAGDCLEHHYNTKFSTPDRDNDDANSSCATSYKSGWWFKACYHTNLNGIYEEGNTDSMSWNNFNKNYECLKEARMMIRATQLLDNTNIATTKAAVAIGGEPRCPEKADDGIYQLKPDYSSIPPFSVFCENGWIVIHRRFNGSLNFNRKWFPYREGFGDLQGEHWLGLEKMHQITRGGSYELMVVLKSFDGVVKTAKYDSFKIGSESEQYRLNSALFGGGNAGDSLESHYNAKFSTPDRDNDVKNTSCAAYFKSGWWFADCHVTNLNGLYEEGNINSPMTWWDFNKKFECLKEARMMIRATQLPDLTNIATEKVDVAIGGEPRCPEKADDGVYQLNPDYSSIPPFPVYCENGWIVIHRRFNGSLNFNRKWVPYREGFGDLQGEHWLGLEKMHQITRVGSYELMVVLKSFDGVVKTAKYDSFKIGSESEQYQLDSALFGGGDAGDSLANHYDMKFSTPDRDNDAKNTSCATSFKSGWWFKACLHTNLNGLYEEGKNSSTMSWWDFNKTYECLKEARMMIRATQLLDHTNIATAKTDVAIGGEPRCPEKADDGIYQLKPDYSSIPPFPVYCENGWIVIHRRFNGSLNFNRKWFPYQEGFGDLQGEHWLGLEKLHQITRGGSFELMVVLKSFDNVVKTAKYKGFKIGNGMDQYQLNLKEFIEGDAGYSLMYQSTMKFSTPDRNNDKNDPSLLPCATFHKSGWWFKDCYHTNLNGLYEEGKNSSTMSWWRFNGKGDCLKEARMMIRAVTE